MFGYVRPVLDKLPEEELRFRRIYCGLCHTLERRHGWAARFILNYDFTFLAILLSHPEEEAVQERRCLASPIKKRSVFQSTPAMELAADESVILAYWQLRDGIADHGFFRGVKYRLGSLLLGRAYRHAAALRPGFDAATRRQLGLLAQLEQEGCTSIDQPADAFAQLLAAAAEEVDAENHRRILREILYHLGRWIYLMDAADDLKKDLKQGNYNPLALRFSLNEGQLTGENLTQFVATVDHSAHLMAAAFELWDFGCWTAILKTVFYAGLFRVGRAVLDGDFHKAKRKTKNDEARR